ncbi:MAG: hypothetical protein JXA99_16780 [Candidatus Lokiarchaeota archaeon]|nr:hypothetical protein [Candidatus Lokiarchaeota archaeon]
MLEKKNIRIWLTIAKKEFRIFTFRFQKNRKRFLIFIIGFLIFWGIYFGPIVLNSIIPSIFKVFGSEYIRDYFLNILGSFFFIIFLVNFLVPIYDFNRKAEIDMREIYLSSPIKIRDVVMADFLWRIPFYLMIVLIVGPFFISILGLIKEIQIIDFFFIYLNLFLLLIFSLLLGMIIMNIIKYNAFRIYKLQRNRVYFIYTFTLLIKIIVYSLQFLVLFLSVSQDYKIYLNFLPPFWYSNIIAYVIDPTFLTISETILWITIILSVLLPIITLFIYYKSVNSSIISENTYQNSKSKFLTYNNQIFKIFSKLILNKWKILVITQLKEFFREKENIAKLFFTVAILILSGIVFFFSYPNLIQFLEDSPFNETIEITINFDQYKFLVIFLITWTGSFFYSIFNSTSSFLDSKELIFHFRKSPRGLKSLIISYIYSQFLIILIVDILITCLISLIFLFDILLILFLFLLILSNNITLLFLGVGLQCYNPLFKYEKKIVFINTYYIIILQLICLFISLNIILYFLPNSAINLDLLELIFLLHQILLIFPTIFLLFFGLRKINRFY